MRNFLLLLPIYFFLPQVAWSQCPNDNTPINTNPASLTCDTGSETIAVGVEAGQYVAMNVVSGNEYTFETCGLSDGDFDTEMTIYEDDGTFIDHNDNDCNTDSRITFIANATGVVRVLIDVSGCTSSNQETSIVASCTDPTPCTITVDFSGSPSACNDNGTPNDPSDDFFTQNIQAIFFNRPATGSLQIVPGGDQIGTYSIPVNQIVGNAHIFIGVKLKADGTPSVVQMNFTDEPTCIDAGNGPTIQPCSSGGGVCEVIGFSFNNIGACNNNGTPSNNNDDFFTVDVDVIYSNSVAGRLLRLDGGDVVESNPVTALVGTNLTQTLAGVKLRADGQITDFNGQIGSGPGFVEICSLPGTGPAVGSCPSGGGTCAMTDMELVNIEPCDDNGTPNDPTDDFYIADIKIFFENPPATGSLMVYGTDLVDGDRVFLIGNVLSIGSPFTVPNTKLRADGQTTSVSAKFTDIPACTIGIGSVGVEPCSYPAPVLTCPADVTVSCASQVPPLDPGSVLETHTCPGIITIVGVFPEFVHSQTCANNFKITRAYNATDECGNVAQCSQFILVSDQTDPTMTCPPNTTVSCASQVPPANIAEVTNVGDNCGGAVDVFNFPGDVISNQSCPNRFTITRSYFAVDACGNSSNCLQTFKINDQTGPIITCPAPQSFSCAEQVPAPNPALVIGGDNCGGAISTSFFSNTISNQTCANRFTLTRQYRATDLCGNTSSCTQVITVNDQTPPVFTSVPANVTVDCYVVPPVGNSTASDNCSGAATVVFVGETSVSGVCPVFKILTRIWRATDACGNSATATQVITVIDNHAPQFLVLPENQIVECGPDNAADFQAFIGVFGGALVEDCAAITYTTEDSPLQSNYVDCGNTFHKNIRFVATDECGNSAFRDASFTVIDQTPPVFSTPPLEVKLECDQINDYGESAYYDWLDHNAFLVAEDNCGTVEVEKLLVHEGSGCGNTWNKTYEFRAKDQCGNLTKITATFAVVDHTPPTVVCPPNDNLMLSCIEDVPLADPSAISASDCSGVTVAHQSTWTNGTGCPGWMMTVAYRYAATDACGNVALCERAFYVEETETPALICPDTIPVDCASDIPGPAQLFAYVKTHLSSDCAGGFTSIQITHDSGQPQNGTTHRTYSITAKNRCGEITTLCSITFKAIGNCNQLCTAPQASWGDPNGTIGNMGTADALQTLLDEYGPVTVGGGNRTVSAVDAACTQEMLFGSGNCSFLPTGQFSCPLPADLANPDGSLNNQLAANTMALQLNIWYNLEFNNRNLGIQDLHNLPPCLVEFELLKDLGQNSTVQDVLNLSNQYLQGFVGHYSPNLPAMLNSAINNLNHFRMDCELNAPCERPGHERFEQENGQINGLQLAPNPTTGVTQLTFDAETATPIELRLSDGRRELRHWTMQAQVGKNTLELLIADLPSGAYYLNLHTERGVKSMRLIKMKD